MADRIPKSAFLSEEEIEMNSSISSDDSRSDSESDSGSDMCSSSSDVDNNINKEPKKGKKRTRQCPLPKCKAKVQQLVRHLMSRKHGLLREDAMEIADEGSLKLKRDKSELDSCPFPGCSMKRARVGRHLTQFHKIDKGTSEYIRLMKNKKAKSLSEEEAPSTFKRVALYDSFKRFKKYLTNMDGGLLEEENAQQHIVRLHRLSSLVGGLDGMVNADKMRECFTNLHVKSLDGKKPISVSTTLVYIGSYRRFLKFAILAKVATFKDFATDLLLQTEKWNSALGRQKRVRHAEVVATDMQDRLRHDEFHLLTSSNNPAKVQALEILRKSEDEDFICDESKFVRVRDYIMMLLVLNSGQRSGCLKNLTCKEILNAEKRGTQWMILAARHKTTSTSGAARIILLDDDYRLVEKYIQRIRPCVDDECETRYAFTNFVDGKQLSSSVINKRLKTVWISAGNRSTFSCTRLRKFYTTSLRRRDPTLRETLASHLTHKANTADRFYELQQGVDNSLNVARHLRSELSASSPTKTNTQHAPPSSLSSSSDDDGDDDEGPFTSFKALTTLPTSHTASSPTKNAQHAPSSSLSLSVDGDDDEGPSHTASIPSTSSSTKTTVPIRKKFTVEQDEQIKTAFHHYIHSTTSRFDMKDIRSILQHNDALKHCFVGFVEGGGPRLDKKIYDRVRVLRKNAVRQALK